MRELVGGFKWNFLGNCPHLVELAHFILSSPRWNHCSHRTCRNCVGELSFNRVGRDMMRQPVRYAYVRILSRHFNPSTVGI